MENFDFDNAWEQVKPSVERFLRKYLRSFEMEDGLQLARIHLFQALENWDPSKSQLNTYIINIMKHRLRDIFRLRYPFSVAFRVIEDQDRRAKVSSWFSIDDNNFEIASDESVEDSVVNSVFLKKFRQDVISIISSSKDFTDRERKILFQFLETGSAPLSRIPRALIKLRKHLEARGYVEDLF